MYKIHISAVVYLYFFVFKDTFVKKSVKVIFTADEAVEDTSDKDIFKTQLEKIFLMAPL